MRNFIIVALLALIAIITYRKQEFNFVNGLFGNITNGTIYSEPVYCPKTNISHMQPMLVGKVFIVQRVTTVTPESWHFLVKAVNGKRIEDWVSYDGKNLALGRKVNCADYTCVSVWVE